MTTPPPPPRIGLNPLTADEVNYNVGLMLRQFVDMQETVGHYQDWLAAMDLKAPPYEMDEGLEATIKTAVGGLDAALDALDMTFINRLIGIW